MTVKWLARVSWVGSWLLLGAVLAMGCCARPVICPCPAPAMPALGKAVPAKPPTPRLVKPPLPPEQPPSKSQDVAPSTPATAEILKILESKRVKGLMWQELSLDQALVYLRTITGLNFSLSPKVREEKYDDVLISAQLDDVTVRAVLDAVLTEPWGLRWEVGDGLVRIRTTDELSGAMRLRYFDVRDLVDPLHPEGFRTVEHLVDAVRALSPKYWDHDGPALEARNGILIARASPAVQEEIDQFLGNRRARLGRPTIDDAMGRKLEGIQINLAVADTTVADVVKILQIQSGVNLMIDPRIVSDVADNPITGLKLEDTALMTALTMLAPAASPDAVWMSRGNVMVLTNRDFVRVRDK